MEEEECQLNSEEIHKNALKLFDEAMQYTPKILEPKFRKKSSSSSSSSSKKTAAKNYSEETPEFSNVFEVPSFSKIELQSATSSSSKIQTLSEVLKEEPNDDVIKEIPEFIPYFPGMPKEQEREYRAVIQNVFFEFADFSPKKRGRVPKSQQSPVKPAEDIKKTISEISQKINELMKCEAKIWSDSELAQLEKYYHIFRDKGAFLRFTTKTLGHLLRKVYGKLENYEIERENDVELQEKRKYWQEYAKNHAPKKKERKKRKQRTEDDF